MSDATPVEPTKASTMKKFVKAFYAKTRSAASKVKAVFIRAAGDNETPIREDEGTARKIARRTLSVPKWGGNALLALARVAIWTVMATVGIAGLIAFAAIGVVLSLVMGVLMAAYKLIHLLALLLRTPYLLTRGGDVLKTDWIGYLNMWQPKYFYFTHISQVYSAQAKEAAEKTEEALQSDLDVEAVRQAAAAQAPAESDLDTVEKGWVEVYGEEAARLRHPAGSVTMSEPKAERHLKVVPDEVENPAQAPKGRPTNRQRKHRPARMPRLGTSEA